MFVAVLEILDILTRFMWEIEIFEIQKGEVQGFKRGNYKETLEIQKRGIGRLVSGEVQRLDPQSGPIQNDISVWNF